MDKLGKDYTRKVYYLKDDKVPEEITDPREEGKFFAESTYVVDINSSTHRYMICWMGRKLAGDERAKTTLAMDELCGGILTSNMTRIQVRKGHETEELLRFFPGGFVILDEARVSMDALEAKLSENGLMFRVQAPYGSAARCIE